VHLATRGERLAVEPDDLDLRRALGDLERLDRRQVDRDPDHDAGRADYQPKAEHQAPIDEVAQSRGAAFGAAARRRILF
jgi:hypothetical protein